MNRSLLTIFLMGVISMVMLSMFGSFFIGKVGGAENVVGLKNDLKQVFGAAMKDPEALKLKVVLDNEESGLLVSYEINPATAAKANSFRFHRLRVINLIYGRSFWKRRAKFVTLRIRLPGGKVHEETFRGPRSPKGA